MTDIKTPAERSKNMAAIKGKNTKPEVFLRKQLFTAGYRYRNNSSLAPGHPDIWLRKYNTAIFVHGCFWHRHSGCKLCYMPKSRVEFWEKKFTDNINSVCSLTKNTDKHWIFKYFCVIINADVN